MGAIRASAAATGVRTDMPAWACMCFGRAEATGGRGAVVKSCAAGSDVERVGCLRIEIGPAPAGLVADGAGEGAGGGTGVAAADGLESGVGAEVIRGGPGILCEDCRVGDVRGNLGEAGDGGEVLGVRLEDRAHTTWSRGTGEYISLVRPAGVVMSLADSPIFRERGGRFVSGSEVRYFLVAADGAFPCGPATSSSAALSSICDIPCLCIWFPCPYSRLSF